MVANAHQRDGHGGKRQLRALRGAMARSPQRRAPPLAAMLAHCRPVTHRYWPGLFHCYHLADLPRTHNDLEPCFGAHRYHDRRATGRKGASPTLVLRGTVRMAVWAATRLRPFTGEERIPASLQDWQALRQQLESRRQQRGHRSRFRRHPDVYLAALEKDLLQLILPP
jgi:hypothetical protein